MDGEDSVGRQKIRLMSPEEIVDKACRTAELLCEAFEEKGWFFHVPIRESEEDAQKDVKAVQKP